MPLMSVWPVSSFSRARKVGSCRFIMSSTSASFLRSVEVSGSMAIEMTVSGKAIDSSRIGSCVLQSVSPVTEWRRPTMPMMSPAEAESTWLRWSAWTRHSCGTFSFLSLPGFSTRLLAFSVPE